MTGRQHIVTVFTYAPTAHRAECTCTDLGCPIRPTVGMAMVEALLHAAIGGCRPNVPLVFDESEVFA